MVVGFNTHKTDCPIFDEDLITNEYRDIWHVVGYNSQINMDFSSNDTVVFDGHCLSVTKGPNVTRWQKRVLFLSLTASIINGVMNSYISFYFFIFSLDFALLYLLCCLWDVFIPLIRRFWSIFFSIYILFFTSLYYK